MTAAALSIWPTPRAFSSRAFFNARHCFVSRILSTTRNAAKPSASKEFASSSCEVAFR